MIHRYIFINLSEYTYYLVRQIPPGKVSTYGAVAKALVHVLLENI